jgi:hypothetical protein
MNPSPHQKAIIIGDGLANPCVDDVPTHASFSVYSSGMNQSTLGETIQVVSEITMHDTMREGDANTINALLASNSDPMNLDELPYPQTSPPVHLPESNLEINKVVSTNTVVLDNHDHDVTLVNESDNEFTSAVIANTAKEMIQVPTPTTTPILFPVVTPTHSTDVADLRSFPTCQPAPSSIPTLTVPIISSAAADLSPLRTPLAIPTNIPTSNIPIIPSIDADAPTPNSSSSSSPPSDSSPSANQTEYFLASPAQTVYIGPLPRIAPNTDLSTLLSLPTSVSSPDTVSLSLAFVSKDITPFPSSHADRLTFLVVAPAKADCPCLTESATWPASRVQPLTPRPNSTTKYGIFVSKENKLVALPPLPPPRQRTEKQDRPHKANPSNALSSTLVMLRQRAALPTAYSPTMCTALWKKAALEIKLPVFSNSADAGTHQHFLVPLTRPATTTPVAILFFTEDLRASRHRQGITIEGQPFSLAFRDEDGKRAPKPAANAAPNPRSQPKPSSAPTSSHATTAPTSAPPENPSVTALDTHSSTPVATSLSDAVAPDSVSTVASPSVIDPAHTSTVTPSAAIAQDILVNNSIPSLHQDTFTTVTGRRKRAKATPNSPPSIQVPTQPIVTNVFVTGFLPKQLTGPSSIQLAVTPTTTVSILLATALQTLAVHPESWESFYLSFQSKVLDITQVISEIPGIGQNANLELAHRFRGGSGNSGSH